MLAVVVGVIGCGGPYSGGGSSPLPAELFDGVAKSNRIARAMVRQQAEELSMGQPVLDNASTLGGTGRMALDVRVTRSPRDLPVTSGSPVTTTDTERPMLPTTSASGTIVGANLALGVVPGFRVGSTRVLGIDALAGATLHSNASGDQVSMRNSGTPFSVTVGFRAGIIEETAALPGLAVSFRRSKGGKRSYNASEYLPGSSRLVEMTGAVRTEVSGWHLTAGKHFGRLGLSAGVGRDSYSEMVGGTATLDGRSDQTSSLLGGTLTNIYGGLAYRVGRVKLAGELRHQRHAESDTEFAVGPTNRTHLTFGVAIGR
jgi:hypothetical protein